MPDNPLTDILKSLSLQQYNNLKIKATMYDKVCLIHSEQRSENIEKYRADNFIPAYYWSHAMLARDWFRYAEHVQQKKQVSKTFLVYNRAWSGTREYRLRFAELLVRLELQDYCKTSVNPIEPELGIHYKIYKFKNPEWRPQIVLENYFSNSDAQSSYSAGVDVDDYNNTDIEVVLETLFDDDRLHLTEKSLRPIACAQPFILAGTHGSLEYLRNYGFKTFGHIWDESYDLIEDPAERLIQIAELMKQITTWLPHQRERNLAEAQAIADYNKKHFFSKEFFNQVTQELKDNLLSALTQLYKNNTTNLFIKKWEKLLTIKEFRDFLESNQTITSPTIVQVENVLKIAKEFS